MKIAGAWIHRPDRNSDSRGSFEEKFKLSRIVKELGRSFDVLQVNQSISAQGVIRGIHYTQGLIGQAKYISCSRGRIWDFVVDIRRESPTFGNWDAVELSPENGLSVLISEGLGHGFLSLEDDSIATYLCTSEYSPKEDRAINVFSKALSIPFEKIGSENRIVDFIVSSKDQNAPEFSADLFSKRLNH